MTALAPDVRVRRCTLTIRRRDGWSWGAGPERYVQAALASLEATLAAAVVESGLEPDADVVLNAPVRLELGGHGDVTRASVAALAASLRAHAAAVMPEAPAPPPTGVAPEVAGDEGGAAGGADVPGPEATTALARTLGHWSRTGRLAPDAADWAPELAGAWVAAIAAAGRAAAPRAAPGSMPAAAVARIAAAILGDALPERAVRPAAEPASLLVLLAALTAALGDRLPDAATQALAAEQAALRAAVAAPAAPEPATAQPAAGPRDRSVDVRRREPAPAGPAEVVVPALPLLVLGELARIGYVDAMVAAAAVAGVRDGAAALATALAGKVLPPPSPDFDRGAALAVTFGAPAELVPDALETIAAHEHVLAPSLSAWLLTAYADGRSAGEEVLVTANAVDVLCGEARGLLSAAWVAGESELDAALQALGRPPVRRDEAFAPLARVLAERSGGLAGAPALERHLGAAAGTALGLLALDVWGDSADSLLALERLDDLEARVRIGPDGVVASIPRGRRWLDLQAAGRLDYVDLPWLAGGRLELGTW